MIYVLLVFGGCAVIVGLMMYNAPPGYEDETGFHEGVKEG